MGFFDDIEIVEEEKRILLINDDFKGTKPVSINFLHKKYYVSSWIQIIIYICDSLYKKNAKKLEEFVNENSSSNQGAKLFSRNPEDLLKPQIIAGSDIYVSTHHDVTDTISVITRLMSKYELPLSSLYIEVEEDKNYTSKDDIDTAIDISEAMSDSEEPAGEVEQDDENLIAVVETDYDVESEESPVYFDIKHNEDIELSYEFNNVFTYALQQNGVSLIRSVTVKNNTSEPVSNLSIRVMSDIDLMESYVETLDEILPGEERTIRTPKLIFHGTFLASMT